MIETAYKGSNEQEEEEKKKERKIKKRGNKANQRLIITSKMVYWRQSNKVNCKQSMILWFVGWHKKTVQLRSVNFKKIIFFSLIKNINGEWMIRPKVFINSYLGLFLFTLYLVLRTLSVVRSFLFSFSNTYQIFFIKDFMRHPEPIHKKKKKRRPLK